MIKVELQMEIEAPPEKVFDYLCYPRFFPEISLIVPNTMFGE